MLPLSGKQWDRFTVHHTPTHGSWLNQAEIEIGLLSRQCLGSRRIPDLKTLRKEVRAWNRDANRRQIKINRRVANFGLVMQRYLAQIGLAPKIETIP